MLPSILMTAALAAGVMAGPLEKRDMVTAYETDYHTAMHTVTQYVTAGAVATPDSTPDTTQQKDVDTTDDSDTTDNGNGVVVEKHYVTVTAGEEESTPAPQLNIEEKQVQEPAASVASSAPVESAAADQSSSDYTGGSMASSSGEDQDYIKRVVNSHNIHRANHSSPNVGWDDSLWSAAQIVAENCSYGHNVDVGGGGYGQNIAAGVEKDNITSIISDMFYGGEILAFEASDGSNDYTVEPNLNPKVQPYTFESWGHFTQVVWKGTTKVACYTADCSAKGLLNSGDNVPPYFTVCNYKDPGNYAGSFLENVLKPKGEATANWAATM